MRSSLALAAALFLAPGLQAQPAVEVPLDRVLGAVVRPDGLVYYDRLEARHRAGLDAALAAVAAQDPAALRTDAQKTAFLLNAYNAHVLDRVLAHPRAADLEAQDLFGAFFRTPVRVAGLDVTLDQLEHGALRRQDRVDGRVVPASLRALRPSRLDPRVHAALNCAAVSCPPLQPRAFRASTLDRDLEARWRAFLASDRAARRSGRTVVLSSIFDWFADDVEALGPLGDVLLEAMPPGRASTFRATLAGKSVEALRRDRGVRFAYDWRVNRAR